VGGLASAQHLRTNKAYHLNLAEVLASAQHLRTTNKAYHLNLAGGLASAQHLRTTTPPASTPTIISGLVVTLGGPNSVFLFFPAIKYAKIMNKIVYYLMVVCNICDMHFLKLKYFFILYLYFL
jgi:hypothetical protein